MIRFELDGQQVEVEIEENMSLRRVFRDDLGLTHITYGCGMGMCGSCTIYIDGLPARTCVFPARAAEGKKIKTDRGLGGIPRLMPDDQ